MNGRLIRRAAALYRNVPLPETQAIGLFAVVVLHRLHPVPLPRWRVLQQALGAVAIAAGCALNAWALVERQRRTTGVFELERPQSLVTTGPYARSRHPMYVGWRLVHLGVGLLRGTAWVAATLPASMLVEHRGVLAEERALERAFGAEFAEYRRRVPRYLPWRWRPTSHARGRVS